MSSERLTPGTCAATLTLGKVSCPTRSCKCLMVLKAKVLMAKGSHKIIDKSLREEAKIKHTSHITVTPAAQFHIPLYDTSFLRKCISLE